MGSLFPGLEPFPAPFLITGEDFTQLGEFVAVSVLPLLLLVFGQGAPAPAYHHMMRVFSRQTPLFILIYARFKGREAGILLTDVFRAFYQAGEGGIGSDGVVLTI